MSAAVAHRGPVLSSHDRGKPLLTPVEQEVLGAHIQATEEQTRKAGLSALSQFPATLESSLCWTSAFWGEEGRPESDYFVVLDESDLKSIQNAVSHFKGLSLDIPFISPGNFPLSENLTKRLRAASDDLHHGKGFSVIRGLDPQAWSDEDNAIIFCGIGSHIGIERSTNMNGMALDHLRNAANDPKPESKEDKELHPSKMIAPLKFHADRNYADIIALFVKSPAAYGGNQYLSSFWTVFNDLRATNPQALEILAQDFPWPGVKDEQPTTTYTPVIFQHADRVFCQLVYRVFEGTNLLSQTQWDALAALERSANQHCIELKAQPGDIQIFNNLALLHARRSWIDRPGKERHLLRLGLRDPQNAWERPPNYAWLFDDRFAAPPKEQTIPVTDFDPYGLTTLENNGHG